VEARGIEPRFQELSTLAFYTLRHILLLSAPAWRVSNPYRSHIRQVMLNRYPASRLSMTAFHLKQRSAEVVSSISPCLFSALVNAYRIKLRELQVYRMFFDNGWLLYRFTHQPIRAYLSFKSLSKPLCPHDWVLVVPRCWIRQCPLTAP